MAENETVKIRVNGPSMMNGNLWMECSRCGAKGPTASMYMSAEAKRKPVQGFYPDLNVRLCLGCLSEAIEAIRNSR